MQRQQPTLAAGHETNVMAQLDQFGFAEFFMQFLPHCIISMCGVSYDCIAITKCNLFAMSKLIGLKIGLFLVKKDIR